MRTLLVTAFLVTSVATAGADDEADPERKQDEAKPEKPERKEPKSDPPIGGATDDKGTFGIGLMIGEPVGIAAKLYLSDDQAVQGAVGSAFFGGGLQIHVDYVFHPSILQSRDSFVLAAYIGPGARMIQYRSGRDVDSNYFALGLRVVGGLLFDFKNPLDAFIEVAGVGEYGLVDGDKGGFGFAINAAAGVRYYF